MNPRQQWNQALDQEDWTALEEMAASFAAREPTALLEKSAQGQTPLERACASPNPRSLALAHKLCELLDAHCMASPVDKVQEALDRSLLAGAGAKECPALLLMLVDAGAMVDAQGPGGRTALHRAIERAASANALALVESGARVDIPDEDGRPAIELLLKSGPGMADVVGAVFERMFGAVAPSFELDHEALDEALGQERARRQEIDRERKAQGLVAPGQGAEPISQQAIEQADSLISRLRARRGEGPPAQPGKPAPR